MRRHSSIRSKLLRAMLLHSMLALACASVATITYDRLSMREELNADLHSLADVVEAAARRPVAHGDKEAVADLLESLAKRGEIAAADLHLPDGSLFAQYLSSGEPSRPGSGPVDGRPGDGRYLTFERDLRFQGKTYGTLYLRSWSRSVVPHLIPLALLLAVSGSVILAAFAGVSRMLRRCVAEPLTRLAELAEHVARSEDLSLRSEVCSDDEIGIVASSFNDMLSRVDRQRDLLARQAEQLKSELADRAQSEERLRAIGATALDGFALVSKEGKLLEVNPAFCRMVEYSEQELVGKPIEQIEAPGLSRLDGQLGRLDEETGGRFETALVCKSGRRIEVDIAATRRKFDDNSLFCSMRDITERKRSEALLVASEQRYRTMIEAAPDAVVMLDVDMWRFVDVNHNAELLFERSKEDLLISSFDVMNPRTQPDGRLSKDAALIHVTSALAGKIVRFEWIHVTKSGREVPCEVRLARMPLTGKIVRGSITDITERRQLEAELRQAQKMEAFGLLAGGVAHDFNNLLTAILGYTEMALNRLEPESRAKKVVSGIKQAADRAAGLVSQLLAFSRKQVLHPRTIDLGVEIPDFAEMLRRLIGENYSLAVRQRSGPAMVRADPSQIQQIVLNLVVNARDAMTGGGEIFIEIGTAELGEEFCRMHPDARPGQYTVFSVMDTGHGMPPETQQRIFEPFFTTKPIGKGTGLGLSTVYGIVKQHGGHIAVESEPGKGSTFTVYLPSAEAGAEPPPAREQDLPQGRGEHLLLVEDDDMVRNLTEEMLAEHGYQVTAVGRPSEALEAVERGAVVDLLVSDVVMPILSGPELARRLSEMRPGLKFVFISGYTAGAAVPDEARDRGLLLAKPFTLQALLEKVRSVLEGRATL